MIDTWVNAIKAAPELGVGFAGGDAVAVIAKACGYRSTLPGQAPLFAMRTYNTMLAMAKHVNPTVSDIHSLRVAGKYIWQVNDRAAPSRRRASVLAFLEKLRKQLLANLSQDQS